MNTVKQEWYSVIPAKKHLAKPMSVYQESQLDRFKEMPLPSFGVQWCWLYDNNDFNCLMVKALWKRVG
jgi:hypothetical protein